MKKLQFKIDINAPVNKVYSIMLGIDDKSTYEQWTALFNPTSSYEGSWSNGSRIHFIGIDEKGEKGGMVSEIAENNPNKFVSIKHIGLLVSGKEILEGPDVEKWTGGFENYSFEENNGISSLVVEVDVSEEFESYMNENYPKALDKLKEICEEYLV
jgi:hypothetical protein